MLVCSKKKAKQANKTRNNNKLANFITHSCTKHIQAIWEGENAKGNNCIWIADKWKFIDTRG